MHLYPDFIWCFCKSVQNIHVHIYVSHETQNECTTTLWNSWSQPVDVLAFYEDAYELSSKTCLTYFNLERMFICIYDAYVVR